MKMPVKFEDLPSVEDTITFVGRERQEREGGPNWAAVSAGFVCPGAGQFMSGQKAAGIAFVTMFIIAVLISFIPLGVQLLVSIQHAAGFSANPPGPMPWFAILGGLAVAIIVWIAAMIHAAVTS